MLLLAAYLALRSALGQDEELVLSMAMAGLSIVLLCGLVARRVASLFRRPPDGAAMAPGEGRGPSAPDRRRWGGRRPAPRPAFASTSVLVLMLLLSLGTIGVVEGLWSKNLNVSGVVETGDLNADWDKIRTEDRCGRTDVALIDAQSLGGDPQTNTYGGGYGDQDHGDDDPCPPDPCPGGYSYQRSGGGDNNDCCPDGDYQRSGGYDDDNDCPPPCPDDFHQPLAGGDPDGDCTPDPCAGDGEAYQQTSGFGGGHDGGDEGDGGVSCPPSCEVSIGGVGDDAEFGDQVAYVDVKHATPGYWCKVKGWLSNTGSVPFNIIAVNGILDTPNEEGLSFEDLNGSQPGDCKLIDHDGHGTAERQVDPGDEGIIYCKIRVDESEKTCTKWHYGICKEWSYSGGAEYGWTYHFAIEVCVAQWNEDPSSGGVDQDFAACKNPSSGTHEGPDTPVLPAPGPTP